MAGLDRAVISPSILAAVDLNRPPNPAFQLVPPEWQLPVTDADSDREPGSAKRVLNKDQENQEPPRQKPKLCLSLKKPGSGSRFSKPVSADELKKAAEGVTPVNTQSSNEWVLRCLGGASNYCGSR